MAVGGRERASGRCVCGAASGCQGRASSAGSKQEPRGKENEGPPGQARLVSVEAPGAVRWWGASRWARRGGGGGAGSAEPPGGRRRPGTSHRAPPCRGLARGRRAVCVCLAQRPRVLCGASAPVPLCRSSAAQRRAAEPGRRQGATGHPRRARSALTACGWPRAGRVAASPAGMVHAGGDSASERDARTPPARIARKGAALQSGRKQHGAAGGTHFPPPAWLHRPEASASECNRVGMEW